MNFSQNGTVCTFTLTENLSSFLLEKKIYFSDNPNVKAQLGRRFTFLDDVCMAQFSSVLRGPEIVSMGAYSYSHSPLARAMSVGNYCSIAGQVNAMGYDHPFERFSTGSFTYDRGLPICADSAPDIPDRFRPVQNPKFDAIRPQIGHDVWIGGRVILANSIRIGTGSIIASGSVVTKDVPPYSIVGGNPARIIRSRFPVEICERLLATNWFLYQFPYFRGVDVKSDIETTIFQLEAVLASGEVLRIDPPMLLVELLLEYEGSPST